MMETKDFTVLIVDDSKENIDILMGILEEHYEISVALDGEDALDCAFSEEPDIILLDIIMPKMNGYDICRELKKNDKTKDIPIIFITAKDSKSSETEGLELGAVDYITKPINPGVVLARVHNHLELKLARQKLQTQNKQLKKMMQMREQLSHMVVHDIRSPIASILGACELVLLEGVNEHTLSFIEDIQEQAERAASFADDLLMLAKAEEDKLNIDLSLVDVTNIMKRVVKNYSFVLQAKKMQIYTQIAPLNVYADKNLFERLIDNLVSNAIKYSPSQSTVTVKSQPSSKEGMSIHIQICDTGAGISDENKQKIFDKFQIADMNQKGVNQVGLGLAFCKMVVDAHKGIIYVTDNEPGSIFNIEL